MLSFDKCSAPFRIEPGMLLKLRELAFRSSLEGYHHNILFFIQAFTRQKFLSKWWNFPFHWSKEKVYADTVLNTGVFTLNGYFTILHILDTEKIHSIYALLEKRASLSVDRNKLSIIYQKLYKLNNNFQVGDKVKALSSFDSYYAGYNREYISDMNTMVLSPLVVIAIRQEGLLLRSCNYPFLTFWFPFYVIQKI